MIRIATAYAWTAAVLLAFGWISGIEDGPLAVAQILTPHVALGGLVLIPIAAAIRSRSLVLPVTVMAILFAVRFGGEWTSLGSAAEQGDLAVATWNIQAGSGAGDIAVECCGPDPSTSSRSRS